MPDEPLDYAAPGLPRRRMHPAVKWAIIVLLLTFALGAVWLMLMMLALLPAVGPAQ